MNGGETILRQEVGDEGRRDKRLAVQLEVYVGWWCYCQGDGGRMVCSGGSGGEFNDVVVMMVVGLGSHGEGRKLKVVVLLVVVMVSSL